MTIITDNYIWFLISGGILLLITIGYFAEQTNFGKKKIGEKIKEADENNLNNLRENVNNIRVNDIYSKNYGTDNVRNMHVDEITEIPDSYISVVPNNSITNNIGPKNNIDNVGSTFMNIGIPDESISNIKNLNSNISDLQSNNVNLNDDDIWKF